MNEQDNSIPRSKYEGVYRDTMYFVDAIVKEYDFYDGIINMIRKGSTEIEVKSRLIKKTVDESWVAAVEAALPSLDSAVRSPGKFLMETEKVQPIELSRGIGNRSLRHLAQHTDYISKVEGDMITPSKILNVYRDETTMTYENKFINTLIRRLYEFVDKRYNQMCGSSSEESTTKLEITSDFNTGTAKGKFTFGIELGEAAQINAENDEKSADGGEAPAISGNLLERVKRLHSAALSYVNSEFCRSMGTKALVKPPIVRTNAITKNKYLRECLLLWEFIQSYQKIGYKIDIEETASAPNESYIHQLYSMLALQYVMFRYNMDNPLDSEALAVNKAAPMEPKFITNFKPYDESDYNVHEQSARPVSYIRTGTRRRPTEDDASIEAAIDAAFVADKVIRDRRAAEKREQERLAALEAKAKRDAEIARQRAIERAEKLRTAELARKEKRRAELAAQKQKTREKREKQKK